MPKFISELRKKLLHSSYGFTAIILLFISQASYAIIIGPNTVISSPTTYSNTNLDLTDGSFIVRNNATLTISNCTITGTLSGFNPTLINVEFGKIELVDNTVTVNSIGITPHPKTESLFYFLRLAEGEATLTGNRFTMDKSFSAGFMITSATVATNNIQVKNNIFQNFHGVLYLLNSSNFIVDDNLFKKNSYGNLVAFGSNAGLINNNKISFAGIDELGNAMDVINSSGITITNNVVFTPTCHGVYLLADHNVIVDSNSITGGITYAISIMANVVAGKEDKNDYAMRLINKMFKRVKLNNSDNITISNNIMSQNRYGLAARDTSNLIVTGNDFSQRFENDAARKFWTDNTNLLLNVTGLTWTSNIYKEAFSQVNAVDKAMTQFVPYPATGGIVLVK